MPRRPPPYHLCEKCKEIHGLACSSAVPFLNCPTCQADHKRLCEGDRRE